MEVKHHGVVEGKFFEQGFDLGYFVAPALGREAGGGRRLKCSQVVL